MDFFHRVLYTAVGAFSIFYFFVKFSLSHWKKRGILHDKPKFLWGNLKGVGSKRHITVALNDIYGRYKNQAPFIGFYAWLRPLIFVLDIELAKRILLDDANNFRDRGLYNNIKDDPLSENLVQLDNDAYKNLHTQVAPCYEIQRMRSLLPVLVRVAETFRRSLEMQYQTSKNFDVRDLVRSYNTDVVSLVAFGLEGDTLRNPDTEFHCMSRNYLNKASLLKLYFAWSFPSIARMFSFRIYNEMASQYFVDLIEKRLGHQADVHRTELADADSITFFTNAKESRIDEESKTRLAAQCFTHLLCGLEASNSTLAFCLYELSLHPSIQDQAREEIETVLSRHKDKLTNDSLNEMVYLKQILYETLRKHTPYPFLLRNTLKDYEVPNSVFMLQAGNSIIIPISSIHHDAAIYPNPKKFDPSRFENSLMSQRSLATFLPFGAGPRACLTREFAEMQMLVCLVTLLRSYKFSNCLDSPSAIAAAFQYDQKKLIVTPKNPILLHLERI